jgi:hypothetical protein
MKVSEALVLGASVVVKQSHYSSSSDVEAKWPQAAS